jgi:hypothetical protein
MNNPTNTAPPIKTGGFKGKRPKAKFSRNLNTGKDIKSSVTRERYLAAQDAGEEELRPVVHAFAETGHAGAAANVTKKQLKAALRRSARDVKRTAVALEKERNKKQRAETIAAARSEAILVARQDAREAKSAARKDKVTLERTEKALMVERCRAEDCAAWEAVLKQKQEEYDAFLRDQMVEVKVCSLYTLMEFFTNDAHPITSPKRNLKGSMQVKREMHYRGILESSSIHCLCSLPIHLTSL